MQESLDYLAIFVQPKRHVALICLSVCVNVDLLVRLKC